MHDLFDSPFVVPVAGCLMILGLGVAGIYSEIRSKELRSRERLELLARGMPPAEVERLLTRARDEERKGGRDPYRSLANARRTAMVLLSSGAGIVLFGLLLWAILRVTPVLIVAAAGLLNVALGAGFLVDYNMQQRELSRFLTDTEPERPADDDLSLRGGTALR